MRLASMLTTPTDVLFDYTSVTMTNVRSADLLHFYLTPLCKPKANLSRSSPWSQRSIQNCGQSHGTTGFQGHVSQFFLLCIYSVAIKYLASRGMNLMNFETIVVNLKINLVSWLFGHSYNFNIFNVHILFVHNPQFNHTTRVYYAYGLCAITCSPSMLGQPLRENSFSPLHAALEKMALLRPSMCSKKRGGADLFQRGCL